MIRTQPVFRSDKFKDRSSDDTFHYRVFPVLHLFPRMKLFSRLIFWCITLSFGCRHPPFSLFFPQNSRDIWLAVLRGQISSPFKTWIQRYVARPLTRFPPLFHSSTIYTEFSFADGNETFEWHLLFVRFEQTKIPLESFLSNHFLWNRVKSRLYNQLHLSYDDHFILTVFD